MSTMVTSDRSLACKRMKRRMSTIIRLSIVSFLPRVGQSIMAKPAADRTSFFAAFTCPSSDFFLLSK